MEVISQTEGKVTYTRYKGSDCVCKRSSFGELQNILKCKSLLRGKEIELEGEGRKFSLKTPQVFGFENGNLYLEKCFGDNLEINLRSGNAIIRNSSVKLVNNYYHFLLMRRYFGMILPLGIFW